MINEEMATPYKPIQGVVVYKKYSDFYLETHDIMEDEGKYKWQEGRPFLREQLKDLSMALGNSSFKPIEIKGMMPANILFLRQTFSEATLIWHLPPAKRMLHFKKDLNLKSGLISLPGLIFCVQGKDLTVIAVKGKNKPTLKSPIFKAPFHNIHEDGKVCMGNIGEYRKKNILEDEISRWERRFFNSYFTHFLDEKVVAKGINLQILFKDLMKSKKPFPEKALVPARYKTVDKLLNHFKK